MTALDRAILAPIAKAEQATATGLASYYARRPRWTKTSTARWLNDRADAVNAAALRHGWAFSVDTLGRGHRLPAQPGYSLKETHPAVFERLHARLAALPTDEAREAALVPTIVR